MQQQHCCGCLKSVAWTGIVWNAANKDDRYLAACTECPRWTVKQVDGDREHLHMVNAYTLARRHAARYKGHSVYVINMTKLVVEKRYRHEIRADQSTPLF